MRMAVDEFVTKLVANILDIVIAGLAAYLGVEHYMQQNIAQLLADIGLVVLHYGIAELVNLFNGILAE